MARSTKPSPVPARPQRHKSRRIRSWRSDGIRTPDSIDGTTAAAEQLFPGGEEGGRLRLARQLRRERVLGGAGGRGYDLARHAVLARALGNLVPDKEKAPRE